MSDSLSTRLARVAKRLGHGVAKDKRNDYSNYGYTSAAAVNKTVGAALSAEGIAITVAFEILPLSTVDQPWVRAMVTYHAGAESLTTEGLGAGKVATKNDEKQLMKAQSVAVKYAHVNAMALGMGEDPESDDDSQAAPEPEKPAAQRVDPAVAAVEVLSALSAAMSGGGRMEMEAAVQHAREVLPYLYGADRERMIKAAQRVKAALMAPKQGGRDYPSGDPREAEEDSAPESMRELTRKGRFYEHGEQ